MDVFLWILQVILAAVFLTLGLVKAVVPMEKLKKAMDWTAEMPAKKVRIIGSLESLGGFGLFFPGLYPISNLVIPISALGLTIIMLLAAIINFRRGDRSELQINILLFVATAFVATARFYLYL
ncbi:MAG: DoxX family protein [Draconibacterium sp.]